MPATLLDTLCLSLPSRWGRSAVVGIAVHSTQTVFISVAVLGVVR